MVFIVDSQLTGKKVAEGDSQYLVDFSQSPKKEEQEVVTDLSKPLLVKKSDCVELK